MSDRPLSRRLIRLAALALGPERAHRADLWPGLAMGPAGAAWRGSPLPPLARLSDLVPRGLPHVTVVGSGPSLAAQDPSRLAPGTALLLNGALSLAGRLPPLAAVVEDERFVHRHAAMVAGLPAGVPLMVSPGALRALLARVPEAVAGRRVALIDDLRRPLGGRRRDLADPGLDTLLERGADGAALSRDPDRGVVIVGTVAFTALQAALAARPGRILLAGIDLANADRRPRFYETEGRAAPSGLVRGLPRILAAFALALRVAQRDGIALACASPVSALLDLGYPYDGALA